MKSTMNQRGLAASIALSVCFTGYSFRLVDLQVTEHKRYAAMAQVQNGHQEPIYARRGAIFDVNNEPLAQNEPVKTVVADGSLIKDPDRLARLLAAPLEMPASVIRARLVRRVKSKAGKDLGPCRYITLRKEVSEAKAAEIADMLPPVVYSKKNENGFIFAKEAVMFQQDFVRVYPNGSLLSHVLGYLNESGVGVDGIEASLNYRLHSTDGHRYVERDRTGREIVLYRGENNTEPRDGDSVRLTIDMNLQRIVENELDAAVKLYRPKKATVIMMNPKTGEIMAMANRPHFNPNTVPKIEKGAVDPTRNIAITDQVDPGSTFKIVTAAAALSEKIVSLDTDINCENGYWQSCKLHDHHPYSSLTVKNILIKSSNIGAAKLGVQLGDQRFYEYARKFGFGDTLNVNLPGEIRGSVLPPDAWDKLTITRMTMGQSVSATPLQIANAMCTIANGGTLMTPQIVRQVIRPEGNIDYTSQEKWRVVSKRATEQVRDALVEVVGPKGTALLAAVPGYKVAGKTGTAQKVDEHGRMSHEKYVLSFVGCMPANDPAFVVLVLIDEARVDHEDNYGGKVAAPVFSRIATKAAHYLNLQPTEPIPLPGKGGKSEGTSDVRDQ